MVVPKVNRHPVSWMCSKGPSLAAIQVVLFYRQVKSGVFQKPDPAAKGSLVRRCGFVKLCLILVRSLILIYLQSQVPYGNCSSPCKGAGSHPLGQQHGRRHEQRPRPSEEEALKPSNDNR